MQSLWLLTKKNVKLLFRSKSSSLIVFFAPLLTILILGLSYNTSSQYGLNIGVYAPSFSADVNSFIEVLQEQEFRIIKYPGSVEDCVKDIKNGAVHTCISLPESLQVENNAPKEITFYLDPTKINLAWMIQETLKTKFNFRAQEISQSLTQDLLSRLADSKTKVGAKAEELKSIREKSGSAFSSVDTASGSLSGLDLTVPTARYDLNILTNITNDVKEAIDQIEIAKDKVADSNLTGSEKTIIGASLSEADELLGDVKAAVGGTGEGSIGDLISELQVDLDIIKEKLSKAAAGVETSTSSLSSASAGLQEVNAALGALETTLTEVKVTLEGQAVTEAGTIVSPLVTKIERVAKEGTYLNYSFSTLLVLVIMFASLLLGTILVMMEKNSPAFLRNYFLPVRKATFVVSIYLTTLALVLVQIFILLGISLFFIPEALAVAPQIILILFVAASAFTFLGMVLGYVFLSEETGILASLSLGSLFLFLSGAVLPLETISPALREATAFNPFVLAEKLVREVFIFRTPLSASLVDLLILISYAALLFLLILIVETFLHQRLSHQFLRHHHKLHREKDKREKNEV